MELGKARNKIPEVEWICCGNVIHPSPGPRHPLEIIRLMYQNGKKVDRGPLQTFPKWKRFVRLSDERRCGHGPDIGRGEVKPIARTHLRWDGVTMADRNKPPPEQMQVIDRTLATSEISNKFHTKNVSPPFTHIDSSPRISTFRNPVF